MKEPEQHLLSEAKREAGTQIPASLSPIQPLFHSSMAFRSLVNATTAAYGTKIFLQLSGGTGRASIPANMRGGPICLSGGLPNAWNPSEKHRALTKEELQVYVEKFGLAAKKAKEAGFDGVEVHAVHEGYLINQFTLKYCNTRTDEYGGSLENRLLFPKQIVESIKVANLMSAI